MCVSGFFFPAMAFLASCQKAIGQPGIVLSVGIVQVILRILLCLGAALAGFGTMGIVIAIAISAIILLPLRIEFARRGMGLSRLRYLKTMGAPAAAAAVMAAAVLGTEHWLGPAYSDLTVLVAMIGVGIVSYMGALALISRRSLVQILVAFRRSPVAPVEALAVSAIEPGPRSAS